MPQLSLETFVSQYFWLVVLFFYFYFQMVNWVIPKISQIIKIRKEVSNVEATDSGKASDLLGFDGPISIASTPSISSTTASDLNKTVLNWCSSKLS